MREPSEILELFESRLRDLSMSQQELGARAFGKADNTAIQSLKKGASPGFDRVAAMADVLGLELYLGLPRYAVDGFSEGQTPTAGQPGRFLPIPWHDPHATKGSAPIAFDRDWLLGQALLPDNLTALVPDRVAVSGWPAKGTLTIIDTQASRIRSFGIWCFKEEGKAVVAKLHFDQGAIIVMPRDPSEAPRLFIGKHATSITILGQVVWSGHVWK